ncbi:MAG: hypothetical protein ACRESS_03235 [Stenotrophobium sp.]
MNRIQSLIVIAAMALPLSVFAASGNPGGSGSAGTTVDTGGFAAVGAGSNPGISMGFGAAINNAFNGNSGDNQAGKLDKDKLKDNK